MEKHEERISVEAWRAGDAIPDCEGGDGAHGESVIVRRSEQGGFDAHLIGNGRLRKVYRLEAEALGPFLNAMAERSPDRAIGPGRLILGWTGGTPPSGPRPPRDDVLPLILLHDYSTLAAHMAELLVESASARRR